MQLMTVQMSTSCPPVDPADHDGVNLARREPTLATLVPPEPDGASSAGVDLGIVILSYNTAGLLHDCLNSVLACAGNFRYQVCVVDNASLDESAHMVERDFPQVKLIISTTNRGYSAGNNMALRWFGFRDGANRAANSRAPRYVLLLNSDTLVSPGTFATMLAFMDERPAIGVAGPRVRLPDGSLDLACRRSFPTPQVSFYRMTGLSRVFAHSQRFNAYNLAFLPEDAVHQVDSVVGAYMQLRREVIDQVGLLDEAFFMYGEDLDWAKRVKDAGWQVWYNGQCEITHVKRASSRQSSKSRIDFYEAMWLFYRKHYRAATPWPVDRLILLGVAAKGGLDVARHLWRFGRQPV
ncbi:MAG TPA: glycosyltransferase family 2 protein [Caldilineaceae bacterium]|nr:glycosyltransferase family 2 protein [Caldilineaceae bacterium]